MNKNYLVSFLFVAFFVAAYANVYSQFGSMPMTTVVQTPYGNVPITTYVPGPRFYYYGQGNISAKYEFHIVLKNDSTIIERTRINLSKDEDNSLTVKHKRSKHEVFPKDTKFVFRMTLEGKQIVGIPADSCWLFKSVLGKINAYSFLAEEGIQYVIAIQEGSGQIVPLTKENLLPMVATNPKALKLAEKDKLLRAITTFN
jgi:hypothetical protein